MKKWEYKKGLHKIVDGIYAYLQPDGSWGWSNAGLIVDGDESLLIDTLFDLLLTVEMLNAINKETKTKNSIDKIVITHANPDHYNGNQLVKNAEIICSKVCAEEMAKIIPVADLLKKAQDIGNEFLTYISHCFGKFQFNDITIVPPIGTFEEHLELKIGNKKAHLIEVGPAHTQSDIIVHIPQDRVVFAGDILFIGGTPIMWAGPVANWIRACDIMIDMDAEVFVPGHGPVTNKKGVEMVKGYLEYIHNEARKRYDAGMGADEAVADIALKDYSTWADSERIVVNVHTLYREFSGDQSSINMLELLQKMAKFWLKQ